MGFMDELKRFKRSNVEDDDMDDYEDDEEMMEEEPAPAPHQASYTTPQNTTPVRAGGKVVNLGSASQLQVVLVKPENFESASDIANHLREKRAVLLNLESTNKDVARRLVDFLSGCAYVLDGDVKKVAISTYILTPYNVEVVGEQMEELGASYQ